MSTDLRTRAAALALIASSLWSPLYAQSGGERADTENYAPRAQTDERALRGPQAPVSVLWSAVDPQDLAADLKRGGFVLLFSWAPDSDLRAAARSSMRSNMGRLSPVERADARRIGEALRALGAPVGLVASSRQTRAREAAGLLADRAPTLSADLAPESGEGLHRFLVAPPLGQNVVVIAHRLAPGAAPRLRELPDGVCAVYHFDAEGEPELVAMLTPSDWRALAGR